MEILGVQKEYCADDRKHAAAATRRFRCDSVKLFQLQALRLDEYYEERERQHIVQRAGGSKRPVACGIDGFPMWRKSV